MGDANIAWTEDHSLRAQLRHLRRFGAKSDRARFVAGEFFQQSDECRARGSFETFVGAGRIYLAGEIGIAAFLFINCFGQQIE